MGIAVDTARSKLYWTELSSGRSQEQANLNGSGAKNVVSGLGSPGDTGAEQQHHGTHSGGDNNCGRPPLALSMMSIPTGSVNNADAVMQSQLAIAYWSN